MIGLLGMERTGTGWTVFVHLPDAAPVAPQDAPPEIPPTVTAKGVACESNAIFPCTTRTPQPAEWLVRAADCNCEYPPEELVTAFCNDCFLEHVTRLKSVEEWECECGLVYRPASLSMVDFVEIK